MSKDYNADPPGLGIENVDPLNQRIENTDPAGHMMENFDSPQKLKFLQVTFRKY